MDLREKLFKSGGHLIILSIITLIITIALVIYHIFDNEDFIKITTEFVVGSLIFIFLLTFSFFIRILIDTEDKPDFDNKSSKGINNLIRVIYDKIYQRNLNLDKLSKMIVFWAKLNIVSSIIMFLFEAIDHGFERGIPNLFGLTLSIFLLAYGRILAYVNDTRKTPQKI